MQLIKEWFRRNFSNPQVVFLALLLGLVFGLIMFMGNMLAPLLIALVLAYLLDGIVLRIQRHKVPRLIAVIVVYVFFMISFLLLILGVVPNMFQQTRSFVVNDLPEIVKKITPELQHAYQRYEEFKREKFKLPEFSTDEPEEDAVAEAGAEKLDEPESELARYLPVDPVHAPTNKVSATPPTDSTPASAPNPAVEIEAEEPPLIDLELITEEIEAQISSLGKRIGSNALGSIAGVVTFLVYLVLVPVLVFFFLKDKERIIRWTSRFMPKESQLAVRVWHDVNIQTSNYIRGKFWEIIIVWSVTHITFSLFGLKSALLLSLFVGLSVLVPYVGAAVMYLPVALIAFYQFGWGSQFVWIIIAYSIIQLLDGNLLAPVLLSEVTNIHPVAIIVSIVVFGGIWGFWGVFFAIPLATLINAVINAWPDDLSSSSPKSDSPPPEKQEPVELVS